jgi:hypothetical protein
MRRPDSYADSTSPYIYHTKQKHVTVEISYLAVAHVVVVLRQYMSFR